MTRLKSTLLALALLTASPAFAQTNIAGDWDVTVVSPQGTNTTPVAFTQDGDKVTGMFKSPQGELPFDSGKMTGNDLTFTFTIQHPGHAAADHADRQGRRRRRWPARPTSAASLEGEWSAKRSAHHDDHLHRRRRRRPPRRRPRRPRRRPATGFGGKWDVMLKTPAGDMPANATLTDDDGKLSGTFGSQIGEVPVAGTVEGKALKLTMIAQTPQGDMTVVHDRRSRRRQHRQRQGRRSGLGQMEWSAKRIKQ